MDEFLRLTVFGLASAAVFFVAASGLVLTYQTTGIFNFAHGALGMIAAYTYWDLTQQRGWPEATAFVVVVFGLGPLMGLVLERVLFRDLVGAPLATTLVVTVGLFAGLLAIANNVWKGERGSVPPLFDGLGDGGVTVFDVFVRWHQVFTIGVAIVVAVGLWLMLRHTRIGIAMRGVVDNRDLALLNGVRSARVSAMSWALGVLLAALAGVLLAPLSAQFEVIGLSLLVINAYAAAVVGRLRSLPLTLLGAVILGLLLSYVPNYVPKLFENDVLPGYLTGLTSALPVLMLFGALFAIPRERLRGWQARVGARLRVPGLWESIAAIVVLVLAAIPVAVFVNEVDLIKIGRGLAIGLVVLSLVPLTGWGGQVSLAQWTLAGFGCWVMAEVGGQSGNPLGLLLAVIATAAVGTVIALPALRLQGLYLALSTLAIAVLAEKMFFPQQWVFYSGGIRVGRLDLGVVDLSNTKAYFVFLALVYGIVAAALLAVRRGPFGRRLAAMRDSPAACATLGASLTRTKVTVFALSAGVAGLGGALFGGLNRTVSPDDFQMTQGLPVLLLAVIGGITLVSGGLFGGLFFAIITLLGDKRPDLRWLFDISPALLGISLARNPDGAVAEIARAFRPLYARVRRGGLEPDLEAEEAPSPEVVLEPADARFPLGEALTAEQVDALDRQLGVELQEVAGVAARG